MLLVGDIGGTHARFALAEWNGVGTPIIHDEQKFVCAEFAGVEEAMERYLGQAKASFARTCVSLAVAGPVTHQAVSFTNSGWNVSAERICEQLHFERAVLLNDLEAVVRAWPHLRRGDLEDLLHSPNWEAHNDTFVVIGIGTGFGMSLVPHGEPARVIPTEAGHTSFAPSNPWEYEVLQVFWKRLGRVSVERLVSGRGLADLYQTISDIEGRKPKQLSASEIAESANRGWDRIAKLTVRMFCELLGSVAGDCALVTGARGGVFLRGHLVESISPILKKGKFRERFEDKGRMRSFLQAVPTRLIVHPEPALLGAAAYAGQ